MVDHINVMNLLRMIVEIKTNPYQNDRDIYTSLGFSRAAFYKYRKYLAEKMDFSFRYSRSKKQFLIEKEQFIPTLNLTLGEMSSLVFSMGQLTASGGDYIVSYRAYKAVQKLISQYPKPSIREKLAILLSETLRNQGYGTKEEILSTIENAIERNKILEIHYHSVSSNAENIYQVDPYIIYFKKRALYMDAYSRAHESIRMFRIGRIKKVRICEGTGFEIHKDYSFKKQHQHAFCVFGGEKTQKVRIRFSSKVADMIQEVLWHPSQKILKENSSGSILFEVEVAHPPEVIWWMRQWGAEAEVLEPEEMREYAKKIALEEIQLYK